jgi:hypothetical protein
LQLALRILTILLVTIFVVLGMSAYIDPAAMLAGDAFAWSPDGIAGLSSGRAVLGGHFLGLALVAVYAFVKSEHKLFYVLAISEFMIATGRLISLAFDGFDERVLFPLGVELFMATAMFSAAKFLQPRTV